MKKLLLGLGTLATIAAPVAAVVSCGTETTNHTNKNKTETDNKDKVEKFTKVENDDANLPAINTLAQYTKNALPSLVNDKITNFDKKGNLVRITFSPENLDTNSDSEDEGTASISTITRVTINLDENKIIKVEVEAGETGFNDVTYLWKNSITKANSVIETNDAAQKVVATIAKVASFSTKGFSINLDAADKLAALKDLKFIKAKDKPEDPSDTNYFAVSNNDNTFVGTGASGFGELGSQDYNSKAQYLVRVTKEDSEIETINIWKLAKTNDAMPKLMFTNSGKKGSAVINFIKRNDEKFLTREQAKTNAEFAKVKDDYIRINQPISTEFFTHNAAEAWLKEYYKTPESLEASWDKEYIKVSDILDDDTKAFSFLINDGEPMIMEGIESSLEEFDKNFNESFINLVDPKDATPSQEPSAEELTDNLQANKDAYISKINATGATQDQKTNEIAKVNEVTTLTEFNQTFMEGFKTFLNAHPKGIISLSHDDAISKTRIMINEILTTTKYKMDDKEITKIVNDIIGISGDYELSIDAVLKGKLKDETHGLDDYMVLIKGAPIKDYTDNDHFSTKEIKGNNNPEEVLHRELQHSNADGSKKGSIGTELDAEDKALEQKWDQTEAEAKEASFVLYFQTKDNGKTTCQLSPVVKFDNKFFELDLTEHGYEHQNEEFNKEFALKEYTATQKGITFLAPGGDAEYPGLDGYRSFEVTDEQGNPMLYSFTDDKPEATTSVATKVEGNKFWDANHAWAAPINGNGLNYDFKMIMSTLELKIIDPLKVTAASPTRGIDKLTDLTLEQFQSFTFAERKSLRDAALKYVTIMAKGTYPKQIETLSKNGLTALSKEDQKIFIDKFMAAFDSFSK